MTKTFKHIREVVKKGMPPGVHVYDKRINRISLMIHKEKNMFVVYIDGEKLDAYRTQREAEKMGKEFIKQYKG
jgi:glycine cleavage system protein P-like pyridoxal-binding family